jgi:hypothetical protein
MWRMLVLLALAPSAALAQEPACTRDEALDRAAAELLSQGAEPSSSDLIDAARRAGSDVPAIDALVIRDSDPRRRERFLTRVAERRAAPLACGEARDADLWLVLAAPRAGALELVGDRALRIVIDPAWREARLYAQDSRGEIWQRAVQASDRISLPGELSAPIRVQLLARGESGPQPIAERVLGEGPPRVVPSTDEPIEVRVGRLREGAGVGPLRHNRLLARTAREYAERICREGRVVHVQGGADPVERLAREGIRARHVGEVAGRSGDRDAAYAAILRSPSHRAALIDRRFTDAGVGEANDARDRTCLVVLLAAWPRPVPY